jgi:hypothetical protein
MLYFPLKVISYSFGFFGGLKSEVFLENKKEGIATNV